MINQAYVAITGNTASGKSSLAQHLSNYWNFVHYKERVDSDVLHRFYSDRKHIAKETEMFFILTRAEDLLKIRIMGGLAVTDYAWGVDSKVYAKNLVEEGSLSADDWKRIADFEERLSTFLSVPDLLIYLKTSIPVVQKRIITRGRREEESMLTPEGAQYMRGLETLHDRMFKEHKGKKAVIHTDNLLLVPDFNSGNPPEHQIHDVLDFMLDCLKRKWEGTAFEFGKFS